MKDKKYIYNKIKERMFTTEYGNYTEKNFKLVYCFNVFLCIFYFTLSLFASFICITSLIQLDNQYDVIMFVMMMLMCIYCVYKIFEIKFCSILSFNKKIKMGIQDGTYMIYTLDTQTKEGEYFKVRLIGPDEIIGYTTKKIDNDLNIVSKIKQNNYIIGKENICIYKEIPENLDILRKEFIEIGKKVIDEDIDCLQSLSRQIDSLDFFQLIIGIEEYYNIEIPMEMIFEDDSLDEIIVKIHNMFRLKKETT